MVITQSIFVQGVRSEILLRRFTALGLNGLDTLVVRPATCAEPLLERLLLILVRVQSDLVRSCERIVLGLVLACVFFGSRRYVVRCVGRQRRW